MPDWEIEQEQALIDLKDNYKKMKQCLDSIKDLVDAEDAQSALEEIKYYVEELYENI